MGLLNKTKCTVIGPMQYSNGQSIRNYFKEELGKLGITVFDHYHKPFINQEVQEGQGTGAQLKEWLKNKEFDKIYAKRDIRLYDLNLIDKSDIIIFHFIPGIVTVGSWEEFFWANRQKKTIFFITEGDISLTPLWVLWTINPKYIYSSKEEVLNIIKMVDSEEMKIDSDRWKLLKEEFR